MTEDDRTPEADRRSRHRPDHERILEIDTLARIHVPSDDKADAIDAAGSAVSWGARLATRPGAYEFGRGEPSQESLTAISVRLQSNVLSDQNGSAYDASTDRAQVRGIHSASDVKRSLGAIEHEVLVGVVPGRRKDALPF